MYGLSAADAVAGTAADRATASAARRMGSFLGTARARAPYLRILRPVPELSVDFGGFLACVILITGFAIAAGAGTVKTTAAAATSSGAKNLWELMCPPWG